MSQHNIALEDWEYKCFEYLMKAEDIDGWLVNFAKQRAKKASEEIINVLVQHCNDNDIALAVGKAAQIDQAFELNIIKTASQREADALENSIA